MTKQNEPLSNFRAPMVTAIGVLLGFILGFAGNWAIGDDLQVWTKTDVLVGVGLLLGSLFLLIALFRMLNMNYPHEHVNRYYQRTLRLFMLGLILSFAGIVWSVFLQF